MATAYTFNFTSQIPPSICTIMFTKRDKYDATIFKLRCSSTAVSYRLIMVEALPLVSTRFLRLAKARRKLRGVPRDGHAMGRNIRQEIRRNVSCHVRATSRQWPESGNSNAAEHPSRRLARQLALRRTWPRNVRAENLRDNSQHGRATAAKHLAR